VQQPALEQSPLSRTFGRSIFRQIRFVKCADRLVVKDHAQQRTMNVNSAIVIDVAEFTKFVHEKINTGTSRADHLRKRLMIDLVDDGFYSAFFAVIRQQ
jgi:hypothetical protein